MSEIVNSYETNVLSVEGEIHDQAELQSVVEKRFAVIAYDVNSRKFVFSARRSKNRSSSYICQLRQGLYKLTSSITIDSAAVAQKTQATCRVILESYSKSATKVSSIGTV